MFAVHRLRTYAVFDFIILLRAFLLGLGLALRRITKLNTAYVLRQYTANITINIAYPSTVLSGGRWVADDSPDDEWEVA